MRKQTYRIMLHLVKFLSSNRAVFSHQTAVSDIHVESDRPRFTSVWSCKFNWSVLCMRSLWHSDLSSLCIVPQLISELICQQDSIVLRPFQQVHSLVSSSAALSCHQIKFSHRWSKQYSAEDYEAEPNGLTKCILSMCIWNEFRRALVLCGMSCLEFVCHVSMWAWN